MIAASRVIAEFSRKSALHAKFNAAREAKKIRRRQILTEPDLRQHVDDKRSAAEEQPQQKDHRYRYAEQPEQKSSSHFSLHENLTDSRTRKRTSGSSKRNGKTSRQCPLFDTDRCSN
jgi:hypothetical protein